MSFDPILSLASISSELEAGWKLFDNVFDRFSAQDWKKKFGKTWTYAEQPYHLAYFDRTIIKYVGYGANVPDDDRMHLKSMGELNAWNAREFTNRAPGHTVSDSLNEMRQAREQVRAQLANMTEADMSRKTWMPLIFGWTTAANALQAMIVHNVAEYWKLWIRTGQKSPAPSPAAVHLRLNFMMNFMPATLNRTAAANKDFTMVWNFEGPGGGAWTFDVHNGKCTVRETAAPRPQLTFTMKPETFHKLVAKMTPPPVLMLTRQMKVKGLGAMGTFARLFPEPKPDEVIAPTEGAAAMIG